MTRGVGALMLAAALIAALWIVARPGRSSPVVPAAQHAPVAPGAARLEGSGARQLEERSAVEGSAVEGATAVSDHPLFAGVLLQVESGQPLPWYHLEVHAPGRSISLRTDAHGRFGAPCPAGYLRIDFHDLPPQPGVRSGLAAGTVLPVGSAPPTTRVRHGSETLHHELRVSSGPTFLLDLERPTGPGLEGLRATLRLNRPSAPGSFEDGSAPLRDEGGRLWVRFGTYPHSRVNGPWGVTVRASDDGWMSGEALTGRGHGLFPTPLRLRLLPRGWVRVRALLGGAPEVWPVTPLLEPVGRPSYEVLDDVAYARNGQARQEETATWLFSGLEAGRYGLTFSTQRHETYRAELEVVAGQVSEHAAHLQRLPSGGDVSGSLRTETGTGTPARRVTLVSQDGQRQLSAAVQWRAEDGRQVGRFVFEDVPAEPYWLAPLARTLHGWEPEGMTIDPPADGIELLCRDGGPHAPIGFLVTDAATGETLDELHLALRRVADSPDQAQQTPLTSGDPIHLRFPLEAPVEWIVSRSGYRPAMGDASAFSERRDSSHGEARFARIALERER